MIQERHLPQTLEESGKQYCSASAGMRLCALTGVLLLISASGYSWYPSSILFTEIRWAPDSSAFAVCGFFFYHGIMEIECDETFLFLYDLEKQWLSGPSPKPRSYLLGPNARRFYFEDRLGVYAVDLDKQGKQASEPRLVAFAPFVDERNRLLLLCASRDDSELYVTPTFFSESKGLYRVLIESEKAASNAQRIDALPASCSYSFNSNQRLIEERFKEPTIKGTQAPKAFRPDELWPVKRMNWYPRLTRKEIWCLPDHYVFPECFGPQTDASKQPGKYTIQVLAGPALEKAREYADTLTLLGLQPQIEVARSGDSQPPGRRFLFRVQVERFDGVSQAEERLKLLADSYNIKGWVTEVKPDSPRLMYGHAPSPDGAYTAYIATGLFHGLSDQHSSVCLVDNKQGTKITITEDALNVLDRKRDSPQSVALPEQLGLIRGP